MSLLLRRRGLLGGSQGWDGKECVAIGNDQHIYYSTDYGATWKFWGVDGANHCWIARSSSLAENESTPFYYTGTYNIIFAKIDGTANVITSNIGGVVQGICGNGDGTVAYTSYNAGSGWQTGYQTYIQKVTRTSVTTKGSFSTWDQSGNAKAACSVDGKYAIIGGAAGYTNAFQTVNFGETWTECLATQSFGNGTNGVAVSAEGGVGMTSTPIGVNISKDNLGTWYRDTPENGIVSYGVAAAGRGDIDDYYYFGLSTGLKIYDRNGRSGFPTGYSNINSNVYTALSCNTTGNKIIGLVGGLIYYSWDWGRTWAQASTPAGVTFKEICMSKYL